MCAEPESLGPWDACGVVCVRVVCGEDVNPLNVLRTGEWGTLVHVSVCVHVYVRGMWSV